MQGHLNVPAKKEFSALAKAVTFHDPGQAGGIVDNHFFRDTA
jgi:hypothetical protein